MTRLVAFLGDSDGKGGIREGWRDDYPLKPGDRAAGVAASVPPIRLPDDADKGPAAYLRRIEVLIASTIPGGFPAPGPS